MSSLFLEYPFAPLILSSPPNLTVSKISTAIDCVKTGFGSDEEVSHNSLTIDQCEKFMEENEFPVGSMGPKIGSLMEAALHNPKCKAILCQPGDAMKALRGEAGTTIHQ